MSASTPPRFAPAPPGIGHNSGPALDRSWRRYAWARARRELVGARPPIEIVRIRVRRAAALGLAYPAYASILMGSGRDIVGFLFTVDGLRLRLRRRIEMPAEVQDRLRAIRSCSLLALSPPEEAAGLFRAELEATAGARFAGASPAPEPGASWSAARAAIRAALAPLGLPGDGVVMIGAREEEARWAEAGRLARFLPGSEYFAGAGAPWSANPC